MLSITYPSSPSCTQPTLQVGCDSSICRQCQNSDHASGKEVGFNARDEEDVVQRWSLEVLMGQLDGQFSSEVLKKRKVAGRQLKKIGEVRESEDGEGKNTCVRRQLWRLEMLSGVQGYEISLSRPTLLSCSMKNL